MKAGLARIDITPSRPVWMDGMLRAHPSTGTHDPIYVKAMVLSAGSSMADACAIVSLDICALSTPDCLRIRNMAATKTGIPHDRMIIAAVHNHSGPATIGFFNRRESAYVDELVDKAVAAVRNAAAALAPAAVGCESGRETTISHYRRLLADDGRVVMNWEPWPAERIVRPLGVIDPELGIVKIVTDYPAAKLLGILFNHAGHPNVLSGDNYLISSDYPGRAEALLEQTFGGTAIFLNGAQGTMDIDGLRDRDWPGVERVAGALVAAAARTVRDIVPRLGVSLRAGSSRYAIPARKISPRESAWAADILKRTGGTIKPLADGVGDDYKAALYQRLAKVQGRPIEIEQLCLAIGDCALLSFPGELFTEIGMRIKAASPFRHTWIVGLANGYIGYIPTREAIAQGGYEPETRGVDDSAEDIIVDQSTALLRQVHRAA